MIHPTPHNAAGHALAMIVDCPGELDNEIIAHRLWPCPWTGPVVGAQDWRRRVAWRKAAAARAAVLLGRLRESGHLQPSTHLRASLYAIRLARQGLTVEEILGWSRPLWLVDGDEEVEMRPSGALRGEILGWLLGAPRRPGELARLLGRGGRSGRGAELSGADKRALASLVEDECAALVGHQWASARGVEVVEKWWEGVAATGALR